MSLLWRLFHFIAFILPFLAAAVVYFSLQSQPLVKNTALLNHSDISRAKEIIHDNDPRILKAGEKKTVTLSASDLSLALNYLLSRSIQGGVETKLLNQAILVHATALLPPNPAGNFLNIKLALKQQNNKLLIERINIGQIMIPGFFLQKLYFLYTSSDQGGEMKAVTDMIKSVNVDKQSLQLSYVWDAATVNQVKDLLLAKQDRQTLLVYQHRLSELSRKISVTQHHSLTVVLQPLFRVAAARSRENHDPIAENRALITVLAAYFKGESLRGLTGEPGPLINRLRLTLHNRYDFAQHFIISAGLAVTGSTSLADALGVYKELHDSKAGSGFSFTDLAADRAGVRFGELATQTQKSARQIQLQMSKNSRETVFMPKTSDLPEKISAAEFNSRYQNIDSQAYRKVVERIDQRIDSLPIHTMMKTNK